MRTIWDLPRDAHRCYLPGLVQSHHIQIPIYNKITNLYKNIETSENETVSFLTECFKSDARSIMKKNYAYIQSTYKDWDIINKNNIQAEVSVLKDIKMCQDEMGKIEGFTTNELLTIYNYTSLS